MNLYELKLLMQSEATKIIEKQAILVQSCIDTLNSDFQKFCNQVMQAVQKIGPEPMEKKDVKDLASNTDSVPGTEPSA